MIQTRAILIDSSTDGGEPIEGTISADDKYVTFQYLDDMIGWKLRLERATVLAAIENEEHG